MSRYVIQIDENKDIAYGFDHAIGYFYDIFDNSKDIDNDEEAIVESASSLFGRNNIAFTQGDMVEVMDKYSAPKEHITQVALDLPF